jgi:hypothetical protein
VSAVHSCSPEGSGSSDHRGAKSELSHDRAVLVFKDFLYINYTSYLCVEDNVEEAIVNDVFRHHDAVLPRVQFGTNAVTRGMTQNWLIKKLENGQPKGSNAPNTFGGRTGK